MNKSWIVFLLIVLALPVSFASAQEQRGVTDRLLEDLREETNGNREEVAPKGWSSVAQEMRRISAQLPRPADTQDTLAAQSAVIEELTKLLAQSKSGSSTPSGSAQTKGEANPKENPTANGGRNAASKKKEEGNTATGKGPATKAGAASKSADGGSNASGEKAEVLVRRAWGQLPGRVRDRLQAGTPEKFHEKYQSETESYFKKLAEMEQRP